jgi:hypothetical protein
VSEHCDGAIRLGKLEKFDKVKRQIKLAYLSDLNAVREGMASSSELPYLYFASLETRDGS